MVNLTTSRILIMQMNKENHSVEIEFASAFFTKETEKAYCCKLWDKKFIAFPKKLVRQWLQGVDAISCFLPVWYLREHSLKSLVVSNDDKEYYFPTKKAIAAQVIKEQNLSLPLLDEVKPLSAEVPDEVKEWF